MQQSNNAHFTSRVHVVTVRDADLPMVMNQLRVLKGTVTAMNEGEALGGVVNHLGVVHVEVERMVDTGKTDTIYCCGMQVMMVMR